MALAALCGLWSTAGAETVTRKEALPVAKEFMRQAGRVADSEPKVVYNGQRLTTDRLFFPFYVFNFPDSDGYVIVSAENKGYPILGYSLEGNFNPAKITDTLKGVLQEYARDIEYIRYDPRIPEKAISAWRDIPATVSETLKEGTAGEADYFRYVGEGWDGLVMRHRSTEFSDLGKMRETVGKEPEETPFSFFEKIVSEEKAEREARERDYERKLIPTDPVITSDGAGHFRIVTPEAVTLGRLYDVAGGMARRESYDSGEVNVSLDGLPAGIYILQLTGENGIHYEFKLLK